MTQVTATAAKVSSTAIHKHEAPLSSQPQKAPLELTNTASPETLKLSQAQSGLQQDFTKELFDNKRIFKSLKEDKPEILKSIAVNFADAVERAGLKLNLKDAQSLDVIDRGFATIQAPFRLGENSDGRVGWFRITYFQDPQSQNGINRAYELSLDGGATFYEAKSDEALKMFASGKIPQGASPSKAVKIRPSIFQEEPYKDRSNRDTATEVVNNILSQNTAFKELSDNDKSSVALTLAGLQDIAGIGVASNKASLSKIETSSNGQKTFSVEVPYFTAPNTAFKGSIKVHFQIEGSGFSNMNLVEVKTNESSGAWIKINNPKRFVEFFQEQDEPNNPPSEQKGPVRV